MTRMNRKRRNAAGPEEQHLDAVSELLAQLRTHLTASAGKKGTYGDYLRLLEFYRETRGERPAEIIVGWVSAEESSPAAA
jgi:hypothetical protein